MEALTLDRAKELAAEVVAEFGEDYVYPNDHRQWDGGVKMCVYVHDGKPSCIVGQILARHGASLVQMALKEFRGADYVTRELVPGTPENTRRFLDKLQGAQDEDVPWGEALSIALA